VPGLSHPSSTRRLTLALTLLVGPHSLATLSWGQARPESGSELTVARLFGSSDFQAEHAPSIHWLKDGSAYLTLENAEGGRGATSSVTIRRRARAR
jgi:hypothetical protein